MSQPSDFSDLDFRDPAIPGHSLVNALCFRDLMRLSDRGRASELVGDRWAQLCAEALGTWMGTTRATPGSGEEPLTYHIDRIARLDDIPAIAATASRKQLQNPDFLLIGNCGGGQVVQPADAKFSVETAKSSQVSADVAANLILLGSIVTDHVAGLADDPHVTDGFFLCPDFSLTHHMMTRRKHGPRGGVSVPRRQIELLPVTAETFMASLDGRDLALRLAKQDGFPLTPHESLLLFLYYFRLARACVGCWIDQTGPLLAYRDVTIVDMTAVLEMAVRIGAKGGSAWQTVREWDDVAEQVRRQRVAIDRAASMPISSGELRVRIETLAKKAGIVSPSMGKVRRAIGSWFRLRLRDEYGTIEPPVENLPLLLKALSGTALSLRRELLGRVDQAVLNSGTETTNSTGESTSR